MADGTVIYWYYLEEPLMLRVLPSCLPPSFLLMSSPSVPGLSQKPEAVPAEESTTKEVPVVHTETKTITYESSEVRSLGQRRKRKKRKGKQQWEFLPGSGSPSLSLSTHFEFCHVTSDRVTAMATWNPVFWWAHRPSPRKPPAPPPPRTSLRSK